MKVIKRFTAVVGGFGLPGLALVRLRPDLNSVATGVRHPYSWFDRVGTDHALVTVTSALLWLAAAWLLLSSVATVSVARSGRTTGLAATVASSVPSGLRTWLLAWLGVSLFLAPSAAYAATSTSAAPSPSAVSAPLWPLQTSATQSPVAKAPAVDWPTTQPGEAGRVPQHSGRPSATGTMLESAPPSTSAQTIPPVPPTSSSSTSIDTQPADSASAAPPPPGVASPSFPTDANPDSPNPASPNPDSPNPGAPSPPTKQSPDLTSPPPEREPPTGPRTTIVRPGDSLWTLAADQLGSNATDADIAVLWPHWYRTNRRVIGADPSLLKPGERLTIPSTEKG